MDVAPDAVQVGLARLRFGADALRSVGRAGRRGAGVGALVRTLIAADLDRALEVHLHRVGELERLRFR